jgi:NAD(P)-dependent dehydrogenase (short-subunit alcohol dehydrogenase family)
MKPTENPRSSLGSAGFFMSASSATLLAFHADGGFRGTVGRASLGAFLASTRHWRTTPLVQPNPSVDATGLRKADEAHSVPAHRQPHDVAQAVVWLASDTSDDVTGTSLSVAGGVVLYPVLSTTAELPR